VATTERCGGAQRRAATPVRPGASPFVTACTVLFAAATAWFVVFMIHPIGPPELLWITTPLYGPLVSVVFWQASRTPAMPAANRRFWRRLTPVATLVGVGQTAQALDVLMHPGVGGSHTGPVMLAFDGVALVVIIHALVRLPTGRQDRGGVLRILLDASTVMLATAVFIWHFGTRQAVGTAAPGSAALSLILVVLALLGVFALAKVMLSDHGVIDGDGLRLLAVAIFVGALAPMVQPLVTAVDPRLYVVQVSVPAVFFFAARAGERQRHAVPGRRRTARTRRRPFSLLPYTAVAAVDGLLLWVATADLEDIVVVAGGAVTLTALVVIRQITSLRDNGRLLAQLDHGATHDALTGLANRVLFHRRLQRALTAAGDPPVSVVLIDLDGFKEVNDTLGHEVGDLLLIGVAERLTACVRDGDTVARLGGDEFVIVLDGSDPAAADVVAQRMTAALGRPVHADGHELFVGASIGIADGRTGDDPSVLLRRADIAMYAAKKIAGTAHLHYDAGMAAAGTGHAGLAAELRTAIEADQLFLLYQPIVALDDGRLIGAEALVRWAHPVRGVLAPDAFLPVAERTGLTVALGRWVMRTAFRQLAEWPEAPGSPAPAMLNVNVSARDLREPGFAAEVGRLLTAYGIEPARITLEITETAALEGGGAAPAALAAVRALGVRVSLDDFGTGFSTLSLLHDCPIDEIKLDRSFTQAPAGERAPVAAAVIHLARALGLHAVAEGVETVEQAEQLLALGYPAAQGFHFGRPRSAEAFAELPSATRPAMATTAPRS
jgi:diguanylate cyclase (GGDEF)-like protein